MASNTFLMWQRFQTLLLLVCAGLLLSLFWSEMCYTIAPGNAGEMERYTIRFFEHSQFMVFSFVTFILTVITIAYFKLRLMQIRLCILNIILLVAYQIWIAVEYFKLKSIYIFKPAALFPIVSAILLAIAIRYIFRDEAMVIAHGMIQKGKKNGKS